ncbi:MAG: Ig-like domain repeat protein, partial [Polaromonas sp.]|nr:Ig-like domain repeat protein [Polaromonas sp.]
DENGDWSVTAEGLSDGEYTPLIKVTDAAGNVSEEFEGEMFVVDLTAPGDIDAHLMNDVVNDTGVAADDNITSNRSPWLEGAGESGVAVSVEIGSQTLTTKVLEDGTWRVQAINLTEGTYTALVTMTDTAGNVSEPFETLPMVIDATAPTLLSAGLAHDEGNDSGASQTDNVTNNRAPVIEGYTDPLALVQMDLAGVHYEIEADDAGYFNFTPEADLADGVYTPTWRLTDTAGNVSTVSTGRNITIDTLPPSVSEFLAPIYLIKGTAANLQPLGADHTLLAGDLVEDYYGNLPEGLIIDDNFNITGTPSVAGATWLAVTQSDAAGNLVIAYQQLVVLSGLKPPSSSITSQNTDPLKSSLYHGTESADSNLALYKSAGDVWLGHGGDDTFKISSLDGLGFAAIDGGAGLDVLQLRVSELSFDLANYNSPDASEKTIQRIEAVVLYGTNSEFSVSAKDIFQLHSDALDAANGHQMLRIEKGGLSLGMSVTLSELSQVDVAKGFNADGSVNAAHTGLYAKYEGSYSDPFGSAHLVSLLVQQGLTTHFVV